MILEETCVCGAKFRIERTPNTDFPQGLGYYDQWKKVHDQCLALGRALSTALHEEKK